jgi:hypothetical protein
MSEALLADTPVGSFVAGTAVDLRHLVPGILNDDIALSFLGPKRHSLELITLIIGVFRVKKIKRLCRP